MFRCLRNSCVECEDNQNSIRRFPGLYHSIVTCFQSFVEKLKTKEVHNCTATESELLAVRCGLQFFGNFVVGNEENKRLVWTTLHCEENSILLCTLELSDEKVPDYTAMVLFNLLNEENIAQLMNHASQSVVISQLLVSSFVRAKSHWSLLVLERLCEEHSFWQPYTQLKTSERLVVLDIIAERVSSQPPQVSEGLVDNLSSWFEENVLDVVKFVSGLDEEKPLEIMRTLSVLATCSVLPRYHRIRENVRLLEASVNVLKAVHVLGKTSSNVFSPVNSMRLRSDSNQDPVESPAYGFKKDLVRLIGNLCASNRTCQDTVRELDGIPLLLDCCNMDAKNPYIIQWCTLALRNVMDNNPENQAVLSSLTVTGELVDSPLLRELGLCVVEGQDGKVTLKRA